MPAKVGIEYGGLDVLTDSRDQCASCGRYIGRAHAAFEATDRPVRSLPLFLSSDGFFIASAKFREFALQNGFQRIEFVPLENRYYVMKVTRCVRYDLSRLDVTQEDFCSVCQTFRRNLVAIAPRPIAEDEAPIRPLEIVESCQKWGVELMGALQHPDLIAGDEAAALLRARRFRGLYLTDTI